MSCSHNNVSMTATYSNNVSIICKFIDTFKSRVDDKDISQNQQYQEKLDRIYRIHRIRKENPDDPVNLYPVE